MHFILNRGGKFEMKYLAFIVFFFLISTPVSAADEVHANLPFRVQEVILKLEKMLEREAAEIRKALAEIEKCTTTMASSENIIRKAREQGNIRAEQIARSAFATAQAAKRKNEDLKRLAEHNRSKAEAALEYVKKGGTQPEARLEQVEYDNMNERWVQNQKHLIEQRLKVPNPYANEIYLSLKTKAPPPLPDRKYDELEPGDVLLVNPEEKEGISLWEKIKDNARDSAFWINAGDRISSVSKSPASHTVLYLKEVNGKKLFLDHTPEKGSHVISEDEFRKTYGHRGALVAQPVKEVDTAKIWEAAKELSKREAQIKTKKSDNIVDQSGYGVFGNDNMVCSEASRWALVNSGLKISESASPLKRLLGIHYGPANFFADNHNFIITPLWGPAGK